MTEPATLAGPICPVLTGRTNGVWTAYPFDEWFHERCVWCNGKPTEHEHISGRCKGRPVADPPDTPQGEAEP